MFRSPMICSRWSYLSLCWSLAMLLAVPAVAENEGLDDLDQATQLKVTAEKLEDLNDVIDRLDTALEKGLDKENADFAQQLLTSTLLQRGTLFSSAVFNVGQQNQPSALQVMQFRQFALNDLQRAVEYDPKLWDAQLLIGRLQTLRMGDPHAAKKALTAVADSTETTAAQRAEALALRSSLQRNKEKQLADLNRAVELQPEVPDFLRMRGQYWMGEKKFDDALTDIDHALQLEPDHAATNELRGMILLSLERYDDALASFNKSSELVPEAALPYQHRGEVYRQKGELDKAAEQLTKALELSPDNVAALIVRAGVYYELKQTEKALADIDQAIRAQPQLVEPYRMKAEIFASTDRFDLAIAELERLVPQVDGPVQAMLLSRIGSFHMLAKQPHKAIEVLNKALDQDPDETGALRLRADAYLNIGQHAEAIADFTRLLSQSNEDVSLLNNYAWVLATSPDDKLRNGAEAVKLATQACELTGYATPHILSTLAAAYAETGDFENAVKWSQKAVEESQKVVEAAKADPETTEEELVELQAAHEALPKELSSFQEKKPVRERQTAEDAEFTPAAKDDVATPAVPPASEPTADF